MESESGYKLKQVAIITNNENVALHYIYAKSSTKFPQTSIFRNNTSKNTDINPKYNVHA